MKKILINNQPDKDKFIKVGPRSFYFKDKVDTIFVYIKDENLIIINEGEDVVDNIVMLNIKYLEDDELVFNSLVQEVLHKF